MAKNFVSDGDVIPWTNATGNTVPSGRLIAMGHILGVALVDIPNGASGSVAIEGVFAVPKVSAAVFAQGEKLVFDVSAGSGVGAVDDSSATPAAGDITGGAVAWLPGLNEETTATIKLTPGNATLTAGG